MSASLTPDEVAEIAIFARTYPEAIPQMRESKDPRELLERVRATMEEVRKALQPVVVAPIETTRRPRRQRAKI